MSAERLLGVLAAALVTVAGLGYLASQTVLAGPGASVTAQQAYVAAPVPARAQQPAVPAGEPVGTPRLDPDWLTDTAAAAGISATALRAYATAQLSVDRSCELGWTTLAGIGWVESQHGTIDDRVLGTDGTPDRPILGPALDGSGDFAAIPASPDSSTWHGNKRWDHALGPMQFIPSTWATWQTDGDGNGTADPHDLDDAALAAARYLCADDHDLTTAQGWADAIFSYNHAQVYVDAVHAAATDYAERTA